MGLFKKKPKPVDDSRFIVAVDTAAGELESDVLSHNDAVFLVFKLKHASSDNSSGKVIEMGSKQVLVKNVISYTVYQIDEAGNRTLAPLTNGVLM